MDMGLQILSIIGFLTFKLSSQVKLTPELEEQIQTFNIVNAPHAKFSLTLANLTNTVSQGKISWDGLQKTFESLGIQQEISPDMTFSDFLDIIFKLYDLKDVDIDKFKQEFLKSVGLTGTEKLQDLKPLNYQPFIPTTDAKGNPTCLNSSQFKEFCSEDSSYPRWYSLLISKNIYDILSGLQKATNYPDCGQPPEQECNYTEISASLQAVPASKFIRSTDMSKATLKYEYHYAVQAETLSQNYMARKCEPVDVKCLDETTHNQYNCANVGPGPLHYRVRRADYPTVLLVINSTGSVEPALLANGEHMICWCKCDR